MIFQILFYLSLVVIVLSCVAAGWLFLHFPLKPFARRLLVGLVILEILTAGLHLYAISVLEGTFWDWFFDLQYELNLGAILSALQFMLIAIAALVNSLFVRRQTVWQRLYWLFLVLIFAFLSIDEFYSIHETWGGRVETAAWRLPYAIGGISLVLISLLSYWFSFREKRRLFALLFLGLAVMGVAGLGVEEFVMRGFVDGDSSFYWLYVIEEIFEMVGCTIVLVAFVAYAQNHADTVNWTRAKRTLVGAGGVWLAWLLFVILGQAAIEARYFATPLDVTYENGLSLVAYTMTPETVEPGGEVEITFYWRADRLLTENYSLSLHLLSHPDIASVAQTDDLHLGPTPSTGWLPGVVMKRTIYLQLPKDVPASESYWLLTRVWYGPWPLGRPWEETTGVPLVSSGDRATISADGLILDHVVVLSPDAPPAPATAVHFVFPNDGFTLYGYELPRNMVTLHRIPVSFWWQTSANGQRDLTQFFHLVPAGGGETIALDGKPFNDSFPTSDWVAGMQVRDVREIALPDSVPAGVYDVYTGLYAPETGERAQIVDADGQPVANNALLLGQLDYAPAFATASDEPQGNIVRADYCFGVADLDVLRNDGQDVMVAMHKQTGEVVMLGRTGTTNVEGMTFNAAGTELYAVDDYGTYGQFVMGDPEHGWLEPTEARLTPPDAPARHTVLPSDPLIDIDSLALDQSNGQIWGMTQDSRLLFEVDPEAGIVVRDRFGVGDDFMQIEVDHLPGADYIKIEDMGIDPRDGTYYVLAASEDFMTMLATIDLDAYDPATGTVAAQPMGHFIDAATGTVITDVEGLSFDIDGTLYAISTNNSNDPAYHDTVWRVELDGVRATRVGQFSEQVDYVDIEALACAGRSATE